MKSASLYSLLTDYIHISFPVPSLLSVVILSQNSNQTLGSCVFCKLLHKSFARHKSTLLRMKQQNVQMHLANTITASSMTQAKGALAMHGLPKRSADGICFHSSNNLSSWERAGRHSAYHFLVSIIIDMFMYSAAPPPLPPKKHPPIHTREQQNHSSSHAHSLAR